MIPKTNNKNKKVFMVFAVIYFCSSLGLGILSLIIAYIYHDCDAVDPTKLSLQNVFLINGIINIVSGITFGTIILVCYFRDSYKILVGWTIARFTVGLTWFVIFSVVLFRSNLECAQSDSVMGSYGITSWFISVLSLFTM